MKIYNLYNDRFQHTLFSHCANIEHTIDLPNLYSHSVTQPSTHYLFFVVFSVRFALSFSLPSVRLFMMNSIQQQL